MSRSAEDEDALRRDWTRTSWIDAANDPACGFPLQSLPYCVFATSDGGHIGVGIGDQILDLKLWSETSASALPSSIAEACSASSLNSLIACGAAANTALRAELTEQLASNAEASVRGRAGKALALMRSATLLKPVESANYTDFYASIHHAT